MKFASLKVRHSFFFTFAFFMSFTFLTSSILSAQVRLPLPPDCFPDDKLKHPCFYIYMLYANGYCNSPDPPSTCFCSTNGYNIDQVTWCLPNQSHIHTMGKMGNIKTTREIQPGEFKNTPMEVIMNPYAGSPGCTVSSEKFPLVLNQKSNDRTVKMRRQNPKTKVAKPKNLLDICRDDCPELVQWIFRPLENNNPSAGLHIQHPAKKDLFLQWTKEKGLVFVPKVNEMTEEEWQAIIWRVGALKNEEGETTGYRISPGLSGLHALSVNKKTGEVGIKEVFKPQQEADPEKGTMATYAVNPKYSSVWQFDNCKPLPPKKEKGIKPAASKKRELLEKTEVQSQKSSTKIQKTTPPKSKNLRKQLKPVKE